MSERLRVLIIEDESLVAMMIEDVLIERGHEVAATAGRLEQGLALASDLGVDLAILDLNLNGQDTFPIAAMLRGRGIPFVFATGYGAAGLGDEWRDVPVLQKPFLPRELFAAIAQVRASDPR